MTEELYNFVTEIKQDLLKIHYKHGKCQDCIALLDKLNVVSDELLQINDDVTLDMTCVAFEAGTVSLRDQIAIAYMQAQVQAGALYSTWDALSGDAYKMADAMLKERVK